MMTFTRFALLLAVGAAASSLSAQAPPQPTAEEKELLDLLNIPVQGASKREQRLLDSPQAIEVITGDELRQQGIYRLQDALKLMTSVDLLESDNGYSVIGLRGVMQQGQPRTVQVLIDGVPQYSTMGGPIDISNLPVTLDLIDKIEVVRGPSSTLYGANAVTGVIAISTKQPGKKFSATLRGSRAEMGTSRGAASVMGGGDTVSFAAGYQGYAMGESGFETHYIGRPSSLRIYSGATTLDPNASPTPGTDSGHGSQNMARVQVKGEDSLFWLSAGMSNKWYGPEGGYFSYRTAERSTALLGWRQDWTRDFHTEFRIHRYHSQNTLSASPFLFALDPKFASEYTWSDVKTTQLEFQANWTMTSNLFMVFGADTRKIEAGKAAFAGLANGASENASGGFLTLDWKAASNLTFSLGMRGENESLGGSRISPRFAMVWNPTSTGALRAGYYTSTRSPQILEQRVDLTVPTSSISPSGYPIVVHTQPNADLKPEKISNFELGYRQSLGAVTLDFTVYKMTFTQLIGSKILGMVDVPPPFSGAPYPITLVTQNFQNLGDATNSGAELAFTWSVSKGVTAGMNIASVSYKRDNVLPGEKEEFSYSPKLKGNLWLRLQQGGFTAFFALQHVGDTYVEALSAAVAPPTEDRDAFTQWHMNLGYQFKSGFNMGLYARNGAKKFTLQGVSSPELQTPYQAMRREVGLTLGYRF